MADRYESMSDDELRAAYAAMQSKPPEESEPDYESMSDDELRAAYAGLSSTSPVSSPAASAPSDAQPDPNAESAATKLSGVKEGDFVAVTGRDGKVSLKKMNAPVDGASVLEDVDDVPDMNKTYTTLSAAEWDAGRESGKVKMNVSPARYRQLQHIAETGSDLFEDDGGKFMSAYADVMPYGGRKAVDKERNKIARMEKYVKGEPDLAPYSKIARELTPTSIGPTKYVSPFSKQMKGISPDEQWAEEARMLGVKGDLKRGKDEDEDAYHKRLQGLVEEKMKETVSRQDWAKKELSYIDKDWKDTVFGEGRQSIAYGLEFAATPVPLGGFLKAGKAANILVKAGSKVVRAAIQTAPVAIDHAASDYEKFRENGYTMRNGDLMIESKGDDPGTALWKAIKNNETEAILEVVGGDLAAPVLRAIGKTIGKHAVGKTLVSIGKAYGKIRDMTHFGDPIFEENLFEEMPQYFFSDVLGWGKKDSEYKGFYEELANAFGYEKKVDPETGVERYEGSWLKGEGMYTPKGFWNTSLAMLLQMGGQAAIAAPGAGLKHIKNNRELANILEGTGMTKEQVANLSYAQREAFRRFHDHFAGNPEKLKRALTLFDKQLGSMADELVRQTTFRTMQTIMDYRDENGQPVKPHLFEVQTETGADGKPRPKFSSQFIVRGDGKNSETRKQMFDPVAQVSIEDNGDGTYCVHDEAHPDRSAYFDNFEEAVRQANFYSCTNQKLRLDNKVKAQYARTLTQGENAKYKKPAVFLESVRDVHFALSNAIREQGGIFGINAKNIGQVFQTDENGEVLYPPRLVVGNTSRGLTTPDGTKIVILDNIRSPEDMNTVLSHEAGHVAGRANQEERLEMLRRASPDSEVGREIARLKAINERLGNKYSEAKILDEAFSNWLSRRGHNPSLMQRLSHKMLGKVGQLNDADFEVIASQIEKDEASGSGENVHFFEDNQFDSTAESAEEPEMPTETPTQGESNETGNVPDEAPAQPEQGASGQSEAGEVGEAEAPVAPRAETPDAGVVKEVAELAKKRQELQSQYDANLDEDGNPQDSETASKLSKEIDAIDSRLGEIEAAKPGILSPELKAVARTPKSANGAATHVNPAPKAKSKADEISEQIEAGRRKRDDDAKAANESLAKTNPSGRAFADKEDLKQNGQVGDKLVAANGAEMEVVGKTANGRNKIKRTRTRKFTVDYGKTWHDGIESGATLPASDYYGDKLDEGDPRENVNVVTFDDGNNEELKNRYNAAVEAFRAGDEHALDNFYYEAEIVGDNDVVWHLREKPGNATAAPAASRASGEAPRRLTSAEEAIATAKTPFNAAEKATLKDAADVSAIDSTDEMPEQRDYLSILSKDAPVVRLNPAKVDRSDAILPNMKKDANRVSGITKPLSGEWHPTMGGIGAVWLTKDGKLVVITGRHRSELAERKGKSMLYYLYREADGFTKDDALIYDAVANIHDEKGTINDYLGFLDRINPTREQAEKAGILSGKGLVAWSLYKDATEAVRSATAMDGNPSEGQISPQQATVIAEAAPRDADKRNPSIQRQLLKTALGGMRGKAFDMYARIRADELSRTPLNENLLAGEQMDLFSSPEDQAADILAQRQSQYRTKKANGYGEVARNLRTALNGEGKLELNDEYAKELGVTDKTDKKQLEAAYDKAVERANYWENTVRLDEADKAAMNAEINAAADARAKKLAELKAKREAAKSGKPKVVVSKNATTTPADETKLPAGETKPAAGETKRPSGETKKADSETKKPVSETQKPALGTENAVSETKTGKTEMSKAASKTPSIKMKDEAAEKLAQQQEDDLAALFDTPELDVKDAGENEAKYLSWAKRWKLDPSKKKNQREWAERNGVSFDTPEFDPDIFQKRVGAVAKLVKTYQDNGVADFKTLATRMAERFPEKFATMKPYLRGVWNAVADQMKLSDVSRDDAERIFSAIEKPVGNAPAETPKAPPANKLMSTRISDAADEIVALIESGEKFTRKEVTDIVERQLGGKVANGDFDAKQVTDILELAVNRYIKTANFTDVDGVYYTPDGDQGAAKDKIRNLRDLLSSIPTQTTRSVEQDKMQQFSTVPHEAFAAAWVANIGKNDVMLEPSAGIGGIAVFGANAGAKVITNELSSRRAEILEQLGIGKPYEFNAENLYAYLEPMIKSGEVKRPTVVVMNPPFSNSQRTNKKNTHIGADHVEQALKLLAPGGRLVAIVGNGMAHDKPAFKAWWDRIGKEYTVRANIGVNGQEYAKYGTTFDNNIIVIDKVAPNGSIAPIYDIISSLDELPAMLEGVRNDRPKIENRKLDTRADERVEQQTVRPGQARAERPMLRPGGNGDRNSQPDGRRVSLGIRGDDGRQGERGEPDGRGDRGDGEQSSLNALLDTDGLTVQSVEQTREVGDGMFSEYKPSKVSVPGMKPHPTALVESSAMASVQPPNPTYSPKIPKKIIEDGVLSEAQIEQVVYAGQAHQQKLGNGERKGYFIGDGTGVGKGREISGIILDNFNNGRRKALWISKTGELSRDAKRDLTAFGLGDELFTLESKNLKGFTSRSHGVAFTTYSSLAENHEGIDDNGTIRASQKAKGGSRMQLLAKWLGRDFDGVIVFDESHKAGNAVSERGKRGMTKPSDMALAVVDLQRILPNARIVYVSATGATEVRNLAYATRLGLWGKGTAFKDREAFINQVSNGGISVMEIVARDMKAMGVYMARTLSYEGIENERVTHELSPDQIKNYNLLADTWQMVMGEIESALISSNGIHGKANGNVKSAFWGAHQRFFNQTLTAMQMPSVLKKAREMWEAGYSPVFQMVSTGEAAQKRSLEKARKAGNGETDIENLDLSPREILIQFVEQSFPTVQYVEEQTDGGKTRWVPLVDSNGNPVHDPAAVERKERLIGRLQRMKLGEAPLDMILNEFGHENVAEITGRTSRREMVRNSDGEMEMRMVRRTKKTSRQEAEDFNDGKRTVLVFSGAGNTGFSFHADRNFKNQRRRVQFLIEAGYNAADAIQGLGRTHRSNESSHPIYELCSTNLPGHKRFMSTIARRLAQLGSLTSGDRGASGSGVFSESDNLENQYAKNAVLDLFEEMFHDDPEKFNRICSEMGFMKARVNPESGEREYVNTLIDADGNFDPKEELAIPHFLNRILAMKIDAQNELFDAFSAKMADMIERAKDAGTFDPGMEKLKGVTVEVKNRTRLWEDKDKIGMTDIVEVGVSKKSKKTDYQTAQSRLDYSAAAGATPTVYVHNASGEVLMMVETKSTKTMADGSIVNVYRQLKPNGESGYTTETAVEKNYTPLFAEGEKRWTEAYDAVPELIEQSQFFAHGTLLPIWDRLGATNPRFFKIAPTGGIETQPFLGMQIDADRVNDVLQRFGRAVGAVEVTPDIILNRIMKDGKKVELQNGWTLKRVKVLGDSRIEIDGVDEEDEIRRLASEGYAYAEKIGYLRAFVKPDAENVAAFLNEYPAIPDKGGLSTVSGTAEDLSGDKYKEPLETLYSQLKEELSANMFRDNDEKVHVAEDSVRNFLVRLSNEQLEEVFDKYAAIDSGRHSPGRILRRIAANELSARGALDWNRYEQAEREAGGNFVDFDTPELMPEEPVPETFGLTNDDIAFARKVAEMKPIGHTEKSHEFQFQQANALLSNREYMEHLAKAVAKVPRATSPHVDLALGIFHKIVEREVNAAREKVKALQAVVEELKGEKDSEFDEERKQSAQDLKDAKKELEAKTQLLDKIGIAHNEGGSEAARTLNLRRALANAADYSYAGIRNAVAEEMAKIKGAITPELEKRIGELADMFSGLDEKQADVLVSIMKPFAESELNKIKNGNKIKRAAERMPGDEAKRVVRNYNDALAQLEVAARETGGVFVGLADEKQPGWGKFLRAIAEYHCFENPDIKVDEVVQKMVETLHACGFEDVDEVSVWDEWTGYGHSFRQSRYESQRRANWLRSQALHKRQLHHMDETNTLPLATGMQRDVDPTPEGRALTKEVYERKKEVPDEGRAERHLKGLLESAKTRIRNTIADLENAIATGEKIPGRDRTVPEDIELRELRKRKEELRKAYDEIFGTTRTLTDAQRVALAETAAARQLEYAMADLERARQGDFSKRPKRPGVESPTLDVLRERTRQAREELFALKNAAFEYGMTPEEVEAYNARRIKRKEDALMKYAERIATGDIRTNVKPKPPLSPEQQKRYDELDEQQKKARRKMKQLREDARRAAWWPAAKSVADYWQYLTGMFVAHKASADRSAVLRQALMLTAAHPVLAAKDMAIAEKAAWSKRKFDEVNADILADPIIRDAVENHGLKLRSTDIANIHDVEMFSGVDRIPPKMIQRLNKLFDMIPGVGKIYSGVRKVDRAILENSERHYVTFLNLMSSQTYKMLLDAIPDASDYQKKRIAYLVNMYSGHGAMSEKTRNNVNSLNNTLGHAIWSPSLAAAQIQQAMFLDVLGTPGISREGGRDGGFATGKEAAQVTKKAVKMRIRAELAILALGSLLALLWSDDDWKSEWLTKWRNVWNASGADKVLAFFNAVEATKHPVLGKTHVDLEMGKRTFNRILGLALTGEYETSTGRMVTTSSFVGKDLADMFGRYFYGKLSPHYSAMFSIANRKTFTGEPVSFDNMLADMLPIPLAAKDVVQSAIEDKWSNLQAPAAIVLTLLGAGGNVYDEKYYERAVNRYAEYKKIENDDLLVEKDKNAILESMRTSYPFLKDDVRYQIEDHIRDINRDKADIQKWRKQGATDDDKDIKEAEAAIETAKTAILELVRKNR